VALWRRQQRRTFQGVPVDGSAYIPTRSGVGRYGHVVVNEEQSLTHSGVWAARRIRADLVSTMPADVFRDLDYGDGGHPVPTVQPKTGIMVDPGGREWDFHDWIWASNWELDGSGNCIGIIRERTGVKTPYYPEGLPSIIELQDSRDCSVQSYQGKKVYKIGGVVYQPSQIYHEKQYPVAGSPVGLSPLIYAAASIGEWLSLQKYGLDWFTGGGVPKAWMRHTSKRLSGPERDQAKQWYAETIRNGDLMVTGHDWEYNMIQAEEAGMEWLQGRRFGLLDIARFYGVPADLIDAAVQGQSITYANITQRNLQFLTMHLGPMVIRREKSLNKLLPAPRYMKFNTKALLRLDPESQQQILRSQLETWQLTLAEVRELDDRRMLTGAQIAEMQRLYGHPTIGQPNPPSPAAPPGPAIPPANTPDKTSATASLDAAAGGEAAWLAA
jgi:HK97 family phage portal protein